MSDKSEPLAHILRPPLPWRDPADEDTECGHKSSEFARVLTGAEAISKIKAEGKRRASLDMCMTCIDTLSRWSISRQMGMAVEGDHAVMSTFDDDPMRRLQREFTNRRRDDGDDRMNKELRAMAYLVERHRDEFDAIMDGSVVLFDDLRRMRKAPDEAAPGGNL